MEEKQTEQNCHELNDLYFSANIVKKKSCPITALNRPTGFQEVKAPRFLDNRHMKVVGCQPYAPAAFTPRIILVLTFRG